MNRLFEIYVTYILSWGTIKTYKYLCTLQGTTERVEYALKAKNLYMLEVRETKPNGYHTLYVREDEQPNYIKHIVYGVNGSIAWIPANKLELPTQEPLAHNTSLYDMLTEEGGSVYDH